jgi:biopolymer transport protein ExbD
MSPHGPEAMERDPRTVTIDVDQRGNISIGRTPVSPDQLLSIMRRAVGEYGQTTPVLIRGDNEAEHVNIRRVMDLCTRAGLYRIKFAAIKDTVQQN